MDGDYKKFEGNKTRLICQRDFGFEREVDLKPVSGRPAPGNFAAEDNVNAYRSNFTGDGEFSVKGKDTKTLF